MGLTRTRPMRRTRMVRHSRPDQPPASAVMAAVGRAWRPKGVTCEICSTVVHGERGLNWSLHHRRGRTGKFTDHSPANLLVVCGASNVDGCHGLVHSRPAESVPNGWILSRIAMVDPLTVPVLLDRGSRWTYLDAAGGYSDNPPEMP